MHNPSNSSRQIGIIGSGFAGLTAAASLASKGHQVHVFEKNAHIGGRARHFEAEGFLFDMGPSWYWMPDVFEQYFNSLGASAMDFYELKKLDPGFKVIFGSNESYDIPASTNAIYDLFESIEVGSAAKLRKFLEQAAYKYQVGMKDLVYQPSHSITEFMRVQLLIDVLRLQVFSSFSKHARRYFSDPRLLAIIEFPVLFLGAMPKDTPALYSLMNHAGLTQGTFYPMGGFGRVVNAFEELALQHGVQFHKSEPVRKLDIRNKKVHILETDRQHFNIDVLIAAADYHHVDHELLPPEYSNYPASYWEQKTFAPSSLIFYLGINKKIGKLSHHNLFFDEDFEQHAKQIYKFPAWPEKPLFYTCCPSKTDPAVAPEGMENIFILIPVAAGLTDSDANTAHYFDMVMSRMEAFCGEEIRSHIIFRRSYSVSNFKTDYNAYKGNAYGLANTLLQTAFLKPKLKNKKLSNMFYSGQLTVPGPGVPPSIISGQIAAKEVLQFLSST
jgi:phytoene desaturase